MSNTLRSDKTRLEAFVKRYGAPFDGRTPEACATGIAVALDDTAGMSAEARALNSVDLYCLDRESLLRVVRNSPEYAELLVFALLDWTLDDYRAARAAIDPPAAS